MGNPWTEAEHPSADLLFLQRLSWAILLWDRMQSSTLLT